jgi:thiol-disulfide isomerase/thioredoxin
VRSAVAVAVSSFVLALAVPVTARADLVSDVRARMAADRPDEARALLAKARAESGVTSTWLAADSWVARGELAKGRTEPALATAKEVRALCEAALATAKLDGDKALQTALGAAIEVEAQAMAARGERAQAVTFLRDQIGRYGGSPIANRLQKNLNLMTLEGKPAPELDEARVLGPAAPTLASLRGRPVLLFFFAHWCGDCKAAAPSVAALKKEFGPRGLAVIAPTQTYGFDGSGDEVAPDKELAWIEEVRTTAYAPIADVPAPVSTASFRDYGASTTPTFVLVDKAGRVALYHPGAMPHEELAARVGALVGGQRGGGRAAAGSRGGSAAER